MEVMTKQDVYGRLQITCRQYGGTLATLDDSTKLQQILTFLTAQSGMYRQGRSAKLVLR